MLAYLPLRTQTSQLTEKEISDSDLSELDDEPRRKRKAPANPATASKGKDKKAKAPAKRRKVAVEEPEVVGGEVGVKDDCALFSKCPRRLQWDIERIQVCDH